MKNRSLLRLGRLAAIAALLIAPGFLPALSVIAPDFNTLVDEADAIFQGEVLSVRSDWTGVGENRHIATYVQFRVIKVFKGSAPNPQTLEIRRRHGGRSRDEDSRNAAVQGGRQ